MSGLAETYGRTRTDTDYFTKLAKRYIKTGDSVVDVGCGAGNYFQLLRELVGKKGAVWAAEPNEEMFAAAKKEAGRFGVKIYRRKTEQLSSLGKKFDVVFASLSLQFCGNDKAFSELRKSVKRGGLLLFVIPTKRDGITSADSERSRKFREFFYAGMRTGLKERNLPPKFDFAYVCGRGKEFRRLLSAHGFRSLRWNEAPSGKAGLEGMLKYYVIPWRSEKIIPGVKFKDRYEIITAALKHAFARYPKFVVTRYHLACAARRI